jgi:hypothetical protein
MGGSAQRLGDTSPSHSHLWLRGVASGRVNLAPATIENKKVEERGPVKSIFFSKANP